MGYIKRIEGNKWCLEIANFASYADSRQKCCGIGDLDGFDFRFDYYYEDGDIENLYIYTSDIEDNLMVIYISDGSISPEIALKAMDEIIDTDNDDYGLFDYIADYINNYQHCGAPKSQANLDVIRAILDKYLFNEGTENDLKELRKKFVSLD